jgi:regulator of RNase E activity RraB
VQVEVRISRRINFPDEGATHHMSDQWIFYPCQMGEHLAFIFYDHGIRDSIDAIAPPHLLKVRVAFKQPGPNGMPTNEEFESLTALEDALQVLIEQHESLYVGRVTVDSHRHFYIYTSDSEQAWSTRLRTFAECQGYAVSSDFEQDDCRNQYWNELFPTADDWQVITDLRVIETLEKNGDDGTASRQIDHWVYLPSQATAEQFRGWAQGSGYTLGHSDASDDGKHCVCFSHTGTAKLADITSHTIALRRKASELGGNYDGWETQVCKTSG